jgi:acyl-CoA synthetase (NDP forming)
MRTLVEYAGIVLADSIDELIDAAEILARYPAPLPYGPGILTFSGALCAIFHDFCADIGLPVPPLSAAGERMLRAALPSFATPRNPLDLTTQPIWQPELIFTGARALLDDPEVGSLLFSLPISQPALESFRFRWNHNPSS